MHTTLRKSTANDAQAIFDIASHPQVLANQNVLADKGRFNEIMAMINQEPIMPDCKTTIDVISGEDAKVIGYIISSHVTFAGFSSPYIELGWDLHPAHWGRSIMPTMIRQHIANLFTQTSVNCIRSACYDDNLRCIRVMEKSGFRPTRFDPIFSFIASLIVPRAKRRFILYRSS